MAINSSDVLRDKNPANSVSSSNTSKISSCRLIKIDFAENDNYSCSKLSKLNNNRNNSPYLANDKMQLLSRMTEKKLIHKKPADLTSSVPLAVSVYKANSDEFKRAKRGNKKFKKSVLTLPNDPAPIPNTYTVSDLNDSEYLNDTNDGRAKPKKRRSVKRNKKPRTKDRVLEYYDRDAHYCSQLNINLDCSSSDILNINGDGEKISKLSYKSKKPLKVDSNSHDVWKILRKINKFQFRPSPPASQEIIVPVKKRKPLLAKNNNHNDTRIIETCMQEFAYISSFEIDNKSHDSCSPSSSFDRVTVIDKQSEQDVLIQQFDQNLLDTNGNFPDRGKNAISNRNLERNIPRLKKNNNGSQNKKKIKDYPMIENNIQTNHSHVEKNNVATICDNIHLSNLQAFDNKKSDTSITSETCYGSVRSIRGNDLLNNNVTKKINIGIRSNSNNISYKPKTLIKNRNLKYNVSKLVDDSGKQISGITKVMLTKDNTILSNLSVPPKRPGLACVALRKSNMPKLTQTEIRRRLANLKFPIVILGNDQITNHAIHVENYEPPQFNGLDQHIWPFMFRWHNEIIYSQNIRDSEKKEIVIIKPKTPKLNHKISYPQPSLSDYEAAEEHRDNKNANISVLYKSVKEVPLHMNRKPKSINILKNKMFQFLQKKNTPTKVIENTCSDDGRLKIIQKDKNVNTSVTIKPDVNRRNIPNEVTKIPLEDRFVTKPYAPLRYPWAKAKRGSDFIENIIKKIRNGVYYGVERKEIKYKTSKCNSLDLTDGTEVSTQTEINVLTNACCQNSIDSEFALKLILSKRDDPLEIIPGFDNTLSKLKIETISTRQIAVKHSITNVVVQFDVQVLGEANNMMHTKNSKSYIPLFLKDKQKKVFKYNSSIHNAVLPAELCSIMPTMMRNILEADKKLYLPAAGKIESDVVVISEFKGSKSPELTMQFSMPKIPEKIRLILNGRFSSADSIQRIIRRTELCLPTDRLDCIDSLYPRVLLILQLLCHSNHLLSYVTYSNSSTFNILDEKSNQNLNRNSNCMALQPYEPRNLRLIPSFGIYNFTEFMREVFDKLQLNVLLYTDSINITSYSRICNTAKNIFVKQSENENIIPITPISKVGIISLFNGYTKYHHNDEEIPDTTFNFTTQTVVDSKETVNTPDINKTELPKKGEPIKKFKKKSFIKCYRKCNSMSSISSYKSTPLSRITNIDDFCQALGSNCLSRVLEGCPERKILAAVVEMKNWITEITPKQALLMLLLTNKKDTRNLIRFRPVLLQGIAVNRITRAVELDTEIEVIERENFNKLPHFEGISYLPASMENQDNLFEELYWIAKTTASDYQKTFDETSEKLLKSLLEKRKKLNPSYLRVMARYVGLGLLTPPK